MYCNPDTIYFKFHNVPDWNVIRNMIDVSWGTIVGNLEDQKDLKDYINNAVTGDINLSDYVTKELLESKHYLTDHQSLADYVKAEALTTTLTSYAKKTDIPSVPTKLSELANDSGYITTYTETDPVWNSEKVNYYTKDEINGKNYLTEHQSLADYAKKSEIPTDYVSNTELTSYATKTYVTEQIGSINSVLENI